MRTIYVITGSSGKAKEFSELFSDMKDISFLQKPLDLVEIQELDSRKITQHKLMEASKHVKGEFIIDDVSFSVSALNGFPGPLVKWLQKSIKDEGIYDLLKNHADKKVIVRCTLGYGNTKKEPPEFRIFEADVEGTIVSPKGTGFGFDIIFMPDDLGKRYSEISLEEKNRISHRGLAAEKLKRFLKKEQ